MMIDCSQALKRFCCRRMFKLLPALWMIPTASAHLQPTTLVALDVGSDRVAMNLHVPLGELELAFGHCVTQHPEQNIAAWQGPFRQYLVQHIHPVTPSGQPWTVQVLDTNVENAVQTQSGPFQEVTVHLALIPPALASLRNLILHYDVIMHQVVTHKALISIQSDWSSGKVEPVEVGRIAVNTGDGKIDPLEIRLGRVVGGRVFKPW